MSKFEPKLLQGGKYEDHRGILEYFNDFDMSLIKRIYFTTHFSTKTIRAWQGHKIESRWFICVKGAFTVKLIHIDDWDNPSDELNVFEYQLSHQKQELLYIPSGYVNGFKAEKENSKLMILSDYKLNEIENDQVRFNQDKWTLWNNY